MSSTPRPHDLVWLNNAAALEAIEESWSHSTGVLACRWWYDATLMLTPAFRWAYGV